MDETSFAKIVDTTGLRCPIPILRAKQALSSIGAGARILVKATDPDSVKDFRSYTELKGHRLLHSDELDGVYRFVIEK